MSVELSIISRKDLCKKIGVSNDTIRKWIKERDFPAHRNPVESHFST